ncbi:hypothetical protein [Roseibium aggregatum]|uniref:hypothetical protein n=1 Tax=Roseibium aggregatum TaxID=187304 RepID=UPI0025AC9840|nr:hypothetical protein [Roseibium aggregatum]WJS05550.1 hypothetical protein QUB73_26790 [Roseibium aggregatum]
MPAVERLATELPETPSVATAVLDLKTRGWTVLTDIVSDRLRDKILRGAGRPDYRHIRQIVDGRPTRVATSAIGGHVFSCLRPGDKGWHRGRVDILASQTPPDFIYGIDLVAPLGSDPSVAALVDGSARLPDGAEVAVHAARRVSVRPGELLMLDCRIWRHLTDLPEAPAVRISIIRSWMTPEEVWPSKELDKMPERAAAFFGRDQQQTASVKEWLVRTHPRRS